MKRFVANIFNATKLIETSLEKYFAENLIEVVNQQQFQRLG